MIKFVYKQNRHLIKFLVFLCCHTDFKIILYVRISKSAFCVCATYMCICFCAFSLSSIFNFIAVLKNYLQYSRCPKHKTWHELYFNLEYSPQDNFASISIMRKEQAIYKVVFLSLSENWGHRHTIKLHSKKG